MGSGDLWWQGRHDDDWSPRTRNRAVDERNIAVAACRSHLEAAALVGPTDPQHDFMTFMGNCEEDDHRRRRCRMKRGNRQGRRKRSDMDEEEDGDLYGAGDDYDEHREEDDNHGLGVEE